MMFVMTNESGVGGNQKAVAYVTENIHTEHSQS